MMDRTILLDEDGCFDEDKITRYVLKLQSRIAELEVSALVWSSEADGLQTQMDRLTKQNKILDEGLEKLSRLGNGDRLGNSDGNVIAQEARQAANELSDD